MNQNPIKNIPENILNELIKFFNNDLNMMEEWLNIPIRRLNNQKPIDFTTDLDKQKELLKVLEEMKYGDFCL